MQERDVPILIVGGGPVGLSASILLSRLGVRSLLIERHPGTSLHPKARGLNVRTLELLRVWGLEPAVRDAAKDLDRARDVAWAPTLLAPEVKRVPYGGEGELASADSPTSSVGCAQDKLEAVLLEAARSYERGELAFGAELVGLDQDVRGGLARVVDRASGEEMSVHAGWVVAADGAQSGVRSLLNIGMNGPGPLFHRMGIYFRADLAEVGGERPALLYILSPPEGPGVMAAVNLRDLWLYMAPFSPERGERVEDFTTQRCVQLIQSAIGSPDVSVEILSALPWAGSAAIAERFRKGRVFLAGDAAHLIPPSGGQAMNVGIQEVHNLAWKLAAHVRGWAGASLLDTYELERRPFALAVMEDASRNAGGFGARAEQFSNRGRVLGISYESPCVILDGTDLPGVANPVTEYAPTGRPGSRAPHAWLQRTGQTISTLDLFDTSFVLLTGSQGHAWKTAAQRAETDLGVPLLGYVVGPGGDLVDQSGIWASLYGIEADGAVLIRPDGHVGWRARTRALHPWEELKGALQRLLGRS